MERGKRKFRCDINPQAIAVGRAGAAAHLAGARDPLETEREGGEDVVLARGNEERGCRSRDGVSGVDLVGLVGYGGVATAGGAERDVVGAGEGPRQPKSAKNLGTRGQKSFTS